MNHLKKSSQIQPPNPGAAAARTANLLKTPDQKNGRRVSSNDRFGKTSRSTNAKERGSVDANSKYAITYLPGATEHPINVGNTLEEAQMKVVLLACEVERLTSSNYELVKEVEVLRVQTDKSQREKDLENKLAIVLAENEKLNQVIEELYELYMSDKDDDMNEGNGENYEKKIAELINDLEDWKQRCNSLEGRGDGLISERGARELQDNNEKMQAALHEMGGQLDAIRNGREQSYLEGKVIYLVEENTRLKDELNAREDQQGKIVQLSARIKGPERNEVVKSHGVRVNPNMSDDAAIDNMKVQDILRENEELRRFRNDADKLKDTVNVLLGDNERLNLLVEKQMNDLKSAKAVPGAQGNENLMQKIEILANENDRLNQLVRDKLEEVDRLRKQDKANSGAKVDDLNAKINSLVERNNQLNSLVFDKEKEVNGLKRSQTMIADGESDLRTKLLLASQDIDRLNAVISDRTQETDRIRKQNIDLQGAQFKAEQASMRVKSLAEDNERLSAVIRDKSRENEDLRIRLAELGDSNRVIEDLKIKLQLVANENERLNKIIIEKLAEMEQLRLQQGDLSTGRWKLEELARTADALKAECDRLNALLVDKTAENERLKTRIRELEHSSSRMIELEDRIRGLQAENERLNNSLKDKGQENSDVRMKLIQVEAMDRTLEEMKNKMFLQGSEIERLRTILAQKDGEIEGLKRRVAADQSDVLRGKVQSLLADNERLNSLLMEKYRETEEVRRSLNNLEGGHGDLANQLEGLGKELERSKSGHAEKDAEIGNLRRRTSELEFAPIKLRELEAVVEGLKGENGVLRKVIEERERAVRELDGRLREAGLEIGRQAEMVDNLRSENSIAKSSLENELVKSRTNLEDKIKFERSKSQSEKDQIEKRTQDLADECDKLRAYLNQVLNDLEAQKRRYAELESLKSEEVEDFKHQFNILKDINREIKDLQLKSAAERTAYEIQISQYEMTLGDMERQRALLVSENERLNTLMVQRSDETSKTRKKLTQSEEAYRLELAELRSQLEAFKANAYDIKQLAIKYSADRTADQSHIKHLSALNDSMKQEISNLAEIMEERRVDLENLRKENEELRKTQAKLVLALQNGEIVDPATKQENIDLLQERLEGLENAKNEYMNQANRNAVELTRRNKELIERIQELDVIKMKYEEAFANYQALNFKLFERLSSA